MTFADELAALQPRPKGPRCEVCKCLSNWAADDAQQLHDALADAGIAAVTLARAISNRGKSISASSVARHRRGECLGIGEQS